ncbi:MAG: hypothetical protein RIS25_679 [Actinomycetota bacterium]|jgi:hypothetical protein
MVKKAIISLGYFAPEAPSPRPPEPYDVNKLLDLIEDGTPQFRTEVCAFPRLPAEALERLARDSDENVRQSLLLINRDLPAELLIRVVEEFPEDYAFVSKHPNAPLYMSEQCEVVRMPEVSLRAFLAAHNANAAQTAAFLAMQLEPELTAGEAWKRVQHLSE